MDAEKNGVPYIVFESVLAKEERERKRLMNVVILLIVGWMITIGIGVWYISLPIEESVMQEVEDIDSSVITQSVGE